MAGPASAGQEVTMSCGASYVVGATNPDGQITYLPGAVTSTCGKLGLRVNYTHVGGSSWTAWTYDSAGFTVQQHVTNAVKSSHSAAFGPLLFTSYR